MQNTAEKSLADDYAAALEWWRDAGVDVHYQDAPQNWLAELEPERPVVTKPASAAAPEEKAPAQPAIDPASIPTELAAFTDWCMSPDSTVPVGPSARIAPRGNAGASLMVLAPMPEAEDTNVLLSARQGKMLSAIAGALGVEPEALYFASALPSHLPHSDWRALQTAGLGQVMQRHIELVAPERLLVFGNKLPALLGHSPDAPPESLTQVGGIPTLVTFAPDRLLDHPRQRARLWKRLLAWTL